MIGFGVSNKDTYRVACENAAGAIIGSKFVALLGEYQSPEVAIRRLLDDFLFKN
jgi:tryptophan synthase alpha chain